MKIDEKPKNTRLKLVPMKIDEKPMKSARPLKDAIWLGPSIAHVHQRRRIFTRK